jgi:FtsH-binding integral membrane protein
MPNDAFSRLRRRSKLGLSTGRVRVGLRLASTLLSVTALAACSASPSRNILGSYFPTWMICALLGLVGVVVIRVIFGKTGIDAALPVPVIVYLCAWLAVTLAIWLIWLA